MGKRSLHVSFAEPLTEEEQAAVTLLAGKRLGVEWHENAVRFTGDGGLIRDVFKWLGQTDWDPLQDYRHSALEDSVFDDWSGFMIAIRRATPKLKQITFDP